MLDYYLRCFRMTGERGERGPLGATIAFLRYCKKPTVLLSGFMVFTEEVKNDKGCFFVEKDVRAMIKGVQ